jgi:hypothetical protein
MKHEMGEICLHVRLYRLKGNHATFHHRKYSIAKLTFPGVAFRDTRREFTVLWRDGALHLPSVHIQEQFPLYFPTEATDLCNIEGPNGAPLSKTEPEILALKVTHVANA